MVNEDSTNDVDELLDSAGAQWRARQVFGAVSVEPRAVRPSRPLSSGLLSPAVGLVAVVAIAGTIISFAPTRFNGAGVEPSAPASSVPTATEGGTPTFADVEAALMPVVEAVNTDQENFGVPYLGEDGILVVQYVSEEARANVETLVPSGLLVRWEKVEYSRAELRRIAGEISDLRLDGVFGVSSGTKSNRVIVKVLPGASIEDVSEALSVYGAAVRVEYSSDIPIIPAGPASTP